MSPLPRTIACPPREVEAARVEPHQLGDAQPAAVEQFEDGAVAQALGRARVGGLDERPQVGRLDDLRQPLRLLRQGHAVEEVALGRALALQVAVEAVDGGGAPRDRGGRGPLLPQRAEVDAEGRAADRERLDARLLAEAQEVADVVVPGHGPLGTRADMAEMRECLLRITEQGERNFAQGRSEEEALASLDLGPFSGWGRQEDRLPPLMSRLYRELRGDFGE